MAAVAVAGLLCGDLEYRARVTAPPALSKSAFDVVVAELADTEMAIEPAPWPGAAAGIDAVELAVNNRWILDPELLRQADGWAALISVHEPVPDGNLVVLAGEPALRIVIPGEAPRAPSIALRAAPHGVTYRTGGVTRHLTAPEGWRPGALTITATVSALGIDRYWVGAETRNASPPGAHPARTARRTLAAQSFDSGWEPASRHGLILLASVLAGLVSWGFSLLFVHLSPPVLTPFAGGFRARSFPLDPSTLRRVQDSGLGANGEERSSSRRPAVDPHILAGSYLVAATVAVLLGSNGLPWRVPGLTLLALFHAALLRSALRQHSGMTVGGPGRPPRGRPPRGEAARLTLHALLGIAFLVLSFGWPLMGSPPDSHLLAGACVLAILGPPVSSDGSRRIWPAGRALLWAVRPIVLLGLLFTQPDGLGEANCRAIAAGVFGSMLAASFVWICVGRAQLFPALALLACATWLLFAGEIYAKGVIHADGLLGDAIRFEPLYSAPAPDSGLPSMPAEPLFRGRWFSREKAGAYRILVLGASVVRGYPLPDWSGNDYCSILEKTLRAGSPDRRLEVMNGGILGCTSELGLLFFEDYLVHYRPDLVVLSYGTNDGLADEPGPGMDRSVARHIRWLRKHPALAELRRLSHRSGVYLALRRLLREGFDPDAAPATSPRITRAELRENYRRFRELAGIHGFRLMVTFDPLPKDVACRCAGARSPSAEPCEGVADFLTNVARELDLPLLEPRDAFCGVPQEELYLDFCHLTEKGNRLLAGELARQIESSGVLRE